MENNFLEAHIHLEKLDRVVIVAVLIVFAMLFGVGQTHSSANEQEETKHIIIEIGENEFEAILTSEEAANEFYEKLPVTLDMSELNNNEKYNYMPDSFTTNSKVANTIENGDIKLYGSSCIVIFYKTFSSGYSYTDIGRIIDPKGLEEAVGQANVSVTFRTIEAPVATNVPTSTPERTPAVTESPTKTPAVTESPTKTPAVTESPTSTPVVTKGPTYAPTNAPTYMPTATPKTKLNCTKKTLVVGEKMILKLMNNIGKVKWYSSKKTVASVGVSGKVTAKKPGKAVVTAKSGNKKYQCKITVKKSINVVAKVGNKKFIITMSDGKAAKQFVKRLPMEIKMSELNSNEKYYYMDRSMQINDHIGGKIKAGDLKLYDGDCLVWFYKSFTTSYEYTDLGYVKNADGLKKALGSKDVTVKFTVK